jgi:hypothetical protein
VTFDGLSESPGKLTHAAGFLRLSPRQQMASIGLTGPVTRLEEKGRVTLASQVTRAASAALVTMVLGEDTADQTGLVQKRVGHYGTSHLQTWH